MMKAKFKMRLAAERAKKKDVGALQESLLGHLAEKDGPRSPLVIARSATLCLVFLGISLVRPIATVQVAKSGRIDDLQHSRGIRGDVRPHALITPHLKLKAEI